MSLEEARWITKCKWVHDVVKRNRAKLRKIDEEIEIWRQRQRTAAKMLEELLSEKENMISESNDYLRLHSNYLPGYNVETSVTQKHRDHTEE